MRRHGISFGIYWRFRPLGDYILATHTEESIELWLTPEGFVCLAEEGQDVSVIVKNGEIFRNRTRAEGEAEIAGIAELREIVALDEEGFEADFIKHRQFILERGRKIDTEMGFSSAEEDKSLTSDPDFDNVDHPKYEEKLKKRRAKAEKPVTAEERFGKMYNLTEENKRFLREMESWDDPTRRDILDGYEQDYMKRMVPPEKPQPTVDIYVPMGVGSHDAIRQRLGLLSVDEVLARDGHHHDAEADHPYYPL
jgi:hypothetical protein